MFEDQQFLYTGAVLLLGLIAILIIRRNQKRKLVAEGLIELLPTIEKAVQDWQQLSDQSVYFTHSMLETWSQDYTELFNQLHTKYRLRSLPLDDDVTNNIQIFTNYFENSDNIRDNRNNAHVAQEKEKYGHLFQSVLSPPLTDAQQNAILHDENNTLVVAGAGTGKTTTLIGKAAYLVESNLAKPEEILAIAFTTRAEQEMEDRQLSVTDSINSINNQAIKFKTFHALGYEIIGVVTGEKPDLVFNGDNRNTLKFFADCLNSIWHNKPLGQKVRKFFLYQLKPVKVGHEFEGKNSYIQYLRGHGLRTVDDRYTVKSFEELLIANSLWEHGIEYEYELNYQEAETRTHDHSHYKPDFYLPDYGIYIEHFAVNRDGDVPPFFRGKDGLSAREYYWSGIEWKRQIHKSNRTTLIETYSYQASEGTLVDSLIGRLRELSVNIVMRSNDDVQKMCYKSKYIPYFNKLILTFITLMKSNQQSVDDIRTKIEANNDRRALVFTELLSYIYELYNKQLISTDTIDYSDMINNATEAVISGEYKSPYKYILIDEFQDMSVGRYQLVNALRQQNEGTKLFCVGDDWQSIFRFTGSDISLMTQFEEYFGFTYDAFLSDTHRFGDRICDATNRFIQANPYQIKKNLKSIRNTEHKAFSIINVPDGNYQEIINKIIEEIIRTKLPGREIAILGRYNHSLPMNKYRLLNGSNYSVECLTVHKAKGLTCDYTILTDVIAGKYGFPSKIADDPVLNYVLHDADQFEDGEERRLFYVAITRARTSNYILTDPNNKSQFISELETILEINKGEGIVLCPQCEVPMIRKSGQYGEFYGCCNYHYCEETMSISTYEWKVASRSRDTSELNSPFIDDDLPF